MFTSLVSSTFFQLFVRSVAAFVLCAAATLKLIQILDPFDVVVDCPARAEPLKSFDETKRCIELISVRTRWNIEQIRTWQGSYKYRIGQRWNLDSDQSDTELSARQNAGVRTDDRIPTWKRSSGEVRFVVDATKNSFFADWVADAPPVFESSGDGKQINVNALAPAIRVLQSPNEFATVQPNVRGMRDVPGTIPGSNESKPVQIATTDVPSASNAFRISSVAFNPIDLFGHGGQQIWEFCQVNSPTVQISGGQKYDLIADGWLKIDVEGGDGTRTVRIVQKFARNANSPDRAFAHWNCEEQFNFLPTRFQATNGTDANPDEKVIEEASWTYTEQAGLWLPNTVRQSSYNSEDGKLTFERELTLAESIMNEHLPVGALDRTALGLENGDRLIDNVSGEEYVKADDQWVPEGEYLSKLSSEATRSSTRRFLVVSLNIALMAIVAAILLYRKRKAMSSTYGP